MKDCPKCKLIRTEVEKQIQTHEAAQSCPMQVPVYVKGLAAGRTDFARKILVILDKRKAT